VGPGVGAGPPGKRGHIVQRQLVKRAAAKAPFGEFPEGFRPRLVIRMVKLYRLRQIEAGGHYWVKLVGNDH
jgi:hypothetical protein